MKEITKDGNLYPLEKFLYTNVHQIKCNDKLEEKIWLRNLTGI